MAETRRRIPLWAVLTAGVLILAAGYFAYTHFRDAGRAPVGAEISSIGGPFELTDQNGRTVTEDDLDDRFKLIYFGYTYCPNACPTALTAMTDALKSLGTDGERIIPVFITVDPARDTPEQLNMYAKYFHPRLVALTGTEEEIASVAGEYQVFYAKSDTRGVDAQDYFMDHTPIIYLMDPDGSYRTHFDPRIEAAELAGRLREIL